MSDTNLPGVKLPVHKVKKISKSYKLRNKRKTVQANDTYAKRRLLRIEAELKSQGEQ